MIFYKGVDHPLLELILYKGVDHPLRELIIYKGVDIIHYESSSFIRE
jgi:hypothetical protein